jgi:AcrR family transcriptional regulator
MENKAIQKFLRRAQLIEAAKVVFADKGYYSTTISDIVKVAGVSQGTFYLYFEDKKSIFEAVREEIFHKLRRYLWGYTAEIKDPFAKLEKGLEAFFMMYFESPKLFHIFYDQAQLVGSDSNLRTNSMINAIRKDVENILDQAITQYSLSHMDTALIAWAVCGMAITTAKACVNKGNPRDLAHQLAAFIRQGLGTEQVRSNDYSSLGF